MESFRSITRGYYRGAAAALIVYDVTNRTSFRNVKRWLEEARQNGNPNLIILLVGNKTDLASSRTVSFDEGQDFARSNDLLFLEASALTADHVEEGFLLVARKILEKLEKGEYDLGTDVSSTQKCGIKVTTSLDLQSAPVSAKSCQC